MKIKRHPSGPNAKTGVLRTIALLKYSQSADSIVVAVLSIRKYLTDYGTDSTNPHLQVCRMLLEGMARSALPWDREEYADFRVACERLSSQIASSQDPQELLAAADEASDALEHYNRGAQRVHAAQTVELRCMIEMLSQTLAALAQSGGQSVQTLLSIRNQVETARQLDDIRILRARLGDTLKSIADEARRQHERSADMLRYSEHAAALAAGHQDTADADRVSGLPSAQAAESEIGQRLGSGSRYYAAIFVVERIESVSLRYGYSAADQLLEIFGRYLESKLTPSDQLYRWRGPSFLLLLDRTAPAETVRAEVSKFASLRQEYAISTNGQQLKLPLTCLWTVVELGKCQNIGQACQQIDRFVAEHWEKRG
jgi:GGDEF domain-containing protein